jgi:hypothetical protein
MESSEICKTLVRQSKDIHLSISRIQARKQDHDRRHSWGPSGDLVNEAEDCKEYQATHVDHIRLVHRPRIKPMRGTQSRATKATQKRQTLCGSRLP